MIIPLCIRFSFLSAASRIEARVFVGSSFRDEPFAILVTEYDAFIHFRFSSSKVFSVLRTDGCGFEVCLTSLLLVTEYDAFIHFRFSFLNLLANASLYRNGCAARVARPTRKV
jgi:hypothetical protein